MEEVSRLETPAAAALPYEERLHGLHAMFALLVCGVLDPKPNSNHTSVSPPYWAPRRQTKPSLDLKRK